MNPTELFRSSTFRLATAFAGFFAGSVLLLFALIYYRTDVFETARTDRLIINDARIVAGEPATEILRLVGTRVTNDFHRLSFAALFDSRRERIAGNVASFPVGLTSDGAVHVVTVEPFPPSSRPATAIRAVALTLADGRFLVIGRDNEFVERLRDVVLRVFEWGFVPALLLSLMAGLVLSWRTEKRVTTLSDAIERIMAGDLRERLPLRGARDDVDRLAASVNRMLDEIERLMEELRGIGDEIAHDLRTPLTRVRARLERAMRSPSPSELESAVDRTIVDLDQTLAIITALLRIREIEAGQRRQGFRKVDLADIVVAIHELYQPIAEEKNIPLEIDIAPVPAIQGDRDLLMEAVGNLVDNAIKFTPLGGNVTVALGTRNGVPVITVADTGPGIDPADREAAFKRFFRAERHRQVPGTGLGLSLVAAITKLHAITIRIEDAGPGCIIDLVFAAEGGDAIDRAPV